MKILGMGNALVDIMTQLKEDSILKKFHLKKGSMTLVDRELSNVIYIETSGLHKQRSSGGSAANTIHGLAHLGIKTAFIGKIGTDEMGLFFKRDMQKVGIKTILYNSINETGKVMALISPDSERTFATYLGAAIELNADDITMDVFKPYHYFYVEGYLVQNTDLIEKSLRLAKNAGLTTCIDLASFNVVEANREFLIWLLKEYVDIVFANEEEARALTGSSPGKAIKIISDFCEIAVIKLGARGSIIQSGKNKIKIEALPVKSIDTTGAGDLYASGFLYGLINSFSLEKSGWIGAMIASKVIEKIGAKIPDPTWEWIRKRLSKI